MSGFGSLEMGLSHYAMHATKSCSVQTPWNLSAGPEHVIKLSRQWRVKVSAAVESSHC